MGFKFNWKLSDDFPYMGQFIPVKTANESWIRSCDEERPPVKKQDTSCRELNDYARRMKQDGFHVLSYFNVTEFGKNMKDKAVDPARRNEAELWKDPVAFAKLTFTAGLLWPPVETYYGAWVTDPGDPQYAAFILEQAQRHIDLIPDASGICIDRLDWLRNYNPNGDDGLSFTTKPTRSLFESWRTLGAKLGPLMHKAGKVIFVNSHPMRQELLRDVDGLYTEFGQDTGCFNSVALQCIRMPAIAWTYNTTPGKNPDEYFQRCLYLGVFPTAPYPNNNHCIMPEPGIEMFYNDYGPLLDAMRGKKWVLEPNCVECTSPEVKVNLFQVSGGYAVPVTFAGTAKTTTIKFRNIKDPHTLKCEALHPGEAVPVPVTPHYENQTLTLTVPLVRGCTMLKLHP